MIATFAQTLMLVAVLGAGNLDRKQMESWLEKKDSSSIKKAFVENEEAALPFFDEYFEGGLAALEEGKPNSVTSEQFAKGVAFARLADEALGGHVFADYAKAYTGWSPQQQKQFRQGQTEYRKARELMTEPAKALEHLEKSLKLCAPLGDTWGAAMCTSKIAVAQHALKRYNQAIESATKAIALNASLHLLGSQAEDLITRSQCFDAAGKRAECERDLKTAVAIIHRIKDAQRRASLVSHCCQMYMKIGKKTAADSLTDIAPPAAKGSPATSQPLG